MLINDTFDHCNALSTLQKNQKLLNEIYSVLINDDLKLGKDKNEFIRSKISERFNEFGWADRVKVENQSNLTISYMKNRVGLCIQFGNVARTYADLLKLTLLSKNNSIDVGIIVVADYLNSKLMGTNYANFERLSREVKIFSKIIEVPLLILSISN